MAVYCGSGSGRNPEYRRAAVELGNRLALAKLGVVYGGGNNGVMGGVANGCLLLEQEMIPRSEQVEASSSSSVKSSVRLLDHFAAAPVVGVLPEDYKNIPGDMHPKLSETVFTKTVAKRRRVMIERSAACVALPGGPGTVDEITEVISERAGRSRDAADRPIFLLNTCGYWDNLRWFFEHAMKEGFLRAQSVEEIFVVCDTPAELVEKIGQALGLEKNGEEERRAEQQVLVGEICGRDEKRDQGRHETSKRYSYPNVGGFWFLIVPITRFPRFYIES